MTTRDKFLILLLIVAVGALAYVSYFDNSSTETSAEDEFVEIDTSEWNTYNSAAFHFSLKYPPDWVIAEPSEDADKPVIHFFKRPEDVEVGVPFGPHENVTNVSVFPRSFAGDFFRGTVENFGGVWSYEVSDESRVFKLRDSPTGTPFAAYLRFIGTPAGWTDDGFMWVRLRVDDFEELCIHNDEVIDVPEGACPVEEEGYRLAHNGTVDEDMWPIVRTIFQSIVHYEAQ